MRIQDNYLNTNVTPIKEGLSNEAERSIEH
jgi:hypothetical protein